MTTIQQATERPGTRIYRVDVIVSQVGGAQVVETRLVRAQNPAQARLHVARERLNARIATQDDMVALLSRGLGVEDATSVGQPEPKGNGQEPIPGIPVTGGYVEPRPLP